MPNSKYNPYCCEEFQKNLDDPITYNDLRHSWNIEGCCGGHCYVLDNVRFCPFCGAKLVSPDVQTRQVNKALIGG